MRRLLTTLAAAATAALIAVGAATAAAPAGATARCRDATYSFSVHHSGTCSHHGGVAVWLDGSASTAGATPAGGSAGASAGASVGASAGAPSVGATILLGPRLRTGGCTRGPSPDRRCSPGAISSGLTRAVICSGSFRTSTIRNVTDATKHAVEVAYGMQPRPYGRTIEIDHIVSLELGGANDPANLFPEPGTAPASYHAKDALENRLHALVCDGRMALRTAQQRIAADWQALYAEVFGAAPTG